MKDIRTITDIGTDSMIMPPLIETDINVYYKCTVNDRCTVKSK